MRFTVSWWVHGIGWGFFVGETASFVVVVVVVVVIGGMSFGEEGVGVGVGVAILGLGLWVGYVVCIFSFGGVSFGVGAF